MASYPQPSADAAVQAGFDFFRLNGTIGSSGTIFESTQSSHVICLGPDSDLATVNVAYFDESAPDNLQLTEISPSRAIIGQLFAQNGSATYSPSQRPGKLLFWSGDLYEPGYSPSGTVLGSFLERIPPVFDVIQYFKPLPSIAPQRSDKSYIYMQLPFGLLDPGTQPGFVVAPYYGRKSATIRFQNRTTSLFQVRIYGVKYLFGSVVETVLRDPTDVAAGAQFIKTLRASVDGTFDAIVVGIAGNPKPPAGEVWPLDMTFSDEEA